MVALGVGGLLAINRDVEPSASSGDGALGWVPQSAPDAQAAWRCTDQLAQWDDPDGATYWAACDHRAGSHRARAAADTPVAMRRAR